MLRRNNKIKRCKVVRNKFKNNKLLEMTDRLLTVVRHDLLDKNASNNSFVDACI